MDFDDIDPVGILFAVIGLGIGVIIAQKMGNGVPARIIVGVLVGFACYFIGSKIASD